VTRVVVALALVALNAAALRAEDGRPAPLREVAFEQRLGEPVPLDLTFRDEVGRAVRLGDYFGKRPVVLSLVYYECPMLCTVSLNGLVSALQVLSFDPGREFELVTVSFNPKETPELAAAKKKVYLGRYKRPAAEGAWHFLTGDADEIARLTKAVGFRYAWDEQTKQFAHPAGITVLTPDGRLARYLYGIEYAPRDLRLALVEAAAGKIGTPVDQLLLYCYRYDPMTGKYSAMIVNLVRLGAILTLLALGVFVGLMRWRERVQAAAPPGRAG
jgi:protein SCO1/2